MEMGNDELSALLEELRNKIENSPNDDMINLEVSTVKKIINYLEEHEDNIEDAELSARYGSRVELPEDQWIKKDPSVPSDQWLEERIAEEKIKFADEKNNE
ncbi:hypothetical protein bcgnr5378_08090 [Bacillus cereus]